MVPFPMRRPPVSTAMIGVDGHDRKRSRLVCEKKNKQQPSFPTTACNRGANGSPQPFVPPFAATNVPTHPGVEPTRGCAQPNMSDTFVSCAAQSQGEGKGREPREDQQSILPQPCLLRYDCKFTSCVCSCGCLVYLLMSHVVSKKSYGNVSKTQFGTNIGAKHITIPNPERNLYTT